MAVLNYTPQSGVLPVDQELTLAKLAQRLSGPENALMTRGIGGILGMAQMARDYDYPDTALGLLSLPAKAVAGLGAAMMQAPAEMIDSANEQVAGLGDGSEVTEGALGMLGMGGVLGNMPRGALASGIARRDLPKQISNQFSGRTDAELDRILDTAEVHSSLTGENRRMSGPASGENWFPGATVKLDTPTSELDSGLLVLPRSNYDAPVKNITWENQIGKTMAPFVGDRTNTGTITRFMGIDLENPVKLYGGKNYMRGAEEGVWASEAGALKPFDTFAKNVENPLGVYMPMAGTGSDFAHMTHDLLKETWSPKKLSKSGVDIVNSMIRTGKGVDGEFPNAPSVTSKKFQEMIETNNPLRKAYIQSLDKANVRKEGGPDMGAIRYAITDPDLRFVESPTAQFMNEQLMGWGAADISPKGIRPGNHPTYDTDLQGKYIGQLPLIPRAVGMRDWNRMRREKSPKGYANDPRSIFTGPTQVPQIIDNEIVDAAAGYQGLLNWIK